MASRDPHRRPLVLAHRGGSGLAPENTIEAFANGLAHGSDGIELDVRLTRDGVPVVIHDPTVDRTTDGTGEVDGLGALDLAALDAGHRFATDGEYPWRGRGCRIPHLGDVLARVAHPILIEIKAPSIALARSVVGHIQAAGADTSVWVGSFHEAVLAEITRLAPHLRRGASRQAIVAAAAGRDPLAVDPGFFAFQVPEVWEGTRIVSPAFITLAHDCGKPVFVWTVDEPDDVVRLLDWGVDAILTDRPDRVVPAVSAWWRAGP